MLRSIKRRADQIFGHVRFIGEIDPRLDECQRLDQLSPPRLGAVADQALELPVRLAALRRCFRCDQVGQAFHGRQVKAAILERTAGELAGLSQPEALDPAQRLKHRGDNGMPAMELQLGHVLAGLAARRRKPECEPLVDDFAASPDRARARAPPAAAAARGRSASPARRAHAAPHTRTTATAAGGRPEERAKIVRSEGSWASYPACNADGAAATEPLRRIAHPPFTVINHEDPDCPIAGRTRGAPKPSAANVSFENFPIMRIGWR